MKKKAVGIITAGIVASTAPLAAQTKAEETTKTAKTAKAAKTAIRAISRDEIFKTFKKNSVAKVKGLKDESFTMDQHFSKMIGISLAWANAVAVTLKEYDVTVPDGKLNRMEKVSDFVDLVDAAVKAKNAR